MTRRLAVGLIAAVIAVSACSRASDPGTLTIAVIPKGTSHAFWQSIHAGAEKAAQELKVTVIWRGPLREDERSAQITEVEGFVTRGVSGIALAPLDDTALAPPVARGGPPQDPCRHLRLRAQGQRTRQLRRDRQSPGRTPGRRRARRLAAEGRQGRAAAVRRRIRQHHGARGGFLEAIGSASNLQVVSSNQYGGADIEVAYKKSEAILSSFKTPGGGLDVAGIFCPNESTSLAMLRVLQDNGWAGKVKFIGFDASDTLNKALADGHIDGLVLQDPVKMGYLAVKTLVEHIRGQPVEQRIDTGVRLVTRAVMNDPDVRELLAPDLKRWLK